MKSTIILVLSLFALGYFVVDGAKSIQNVHIALVGDPTSMVISWKTKDESSNSIVQYGVSSGVYSMQGYGNQSSYSSKSGWNHNVVLINLQPGTKYYFICGDSSYAWSPEYTFVTSKGLGYQNRPWTLAVYGDLGTDNSANTIQRLNYKAITTNSTDLSQNIDHFFHLGDLSYANDHPLEYESIWDDWFEDMQPAMGARPYMACPGNHESWCRNPICAESTRNFTTFKEKFRMPGPECGTNTNMFYSYDYENVHIISISTESDWPGAHIDPQPKPLIYDNLKLSAAAATKRSSMSSEKKRQISVIQEKLKLNEDELNELIVDEQAYFQVNWFLQDLQQAAANRAKIPWIVVAGHRPIYSVTEQTDGKPTGTASKLQQWLEPLFQQYGVDFYLTGHVHAYMRTYPVYNNEVTSTSYTNPNSTVHIVSGAAGNREGHSSFPSTKPSWYAFGDNTDYGYGLLQFVNNTYAVWNFYRSDTDALVDTFALSRQH